MALALFDLDNTLLAGDSDYEWGQFLVAKGAVDAEVYEQANLKFYDQYKSGTLDIHEFLYFAFTPYKKYSRKQLDAWHKEFLEEKIRPIMLEQAKDCIKWHQDRGDILLVITATNSFVTRPITEAFGIMNLIATTPEEVDGEFTGEIAGTPCFQEGKVTRLTEWLTSTGNTLENSWFYSDSHNDLPLLNKVTHPIAVDADETLTKVAQEKGWKITSFRKELE